MNSSVNRRRCSRKSITPWKTSSAKTIGTTDQKIRARNVEKPLHHRQPVLKSLRTPSAVSAPSLTGADAEGGGISRRRSSGLVILAHRWLAPQNVYSRPRDQMT